MYTEFLTIINENGQEEKAKLHYGSNLVTNPREFWTNLGVVVITKAYVDFGKIDENARTVEDIYDIIKNRA